MDRPDWEQIYLEGRNKIRWALQTTLKESPVIQPNFSDWMYVAGKVMDDIISELKRQEEKPNYSPWWKQRGQKTPTGPSWSGS